MATSPPRPARRRARAEDRRHRAAATAAAPLGPAPEPAPPCSSALIGVSTRGVSGCCAGGRAVDLQQIRGDVQRALFAQRARIRRRHRLHEIGEELVDRSRSPLRAEVDARDRRGVAAAAKIRAVASGALLRVRRFAGLRLRGGEHAAGRGLRLLAADRRDGETDEDSRSRKKRWPLTRFICGS